MATSQRKEKYLISLYRHKCYIWTALLVLKGVSLCWKEPWSTNYMLMETYREAI